MNKKIYILFFFMLCSFFMQAKKVKFTVDMSGQVLSSLGIHVIGDFQTIAGLGADFIPDPLCKMTKDLTDTNLYYLFADIPAFAKYEYKYVNGDQTYEVEIVPELSQVGYNFDDNRWIYIDSLANDTTKLASVQFSQNGPKGLNTIRFKADMTLQTVSPQGVHVAGSFQSNDPKTHKLYSFGNNVYEIIAYMPAASYDYKYYNGSTLADAETVPSSCAVSGNRTIALSQDTLLNVCYALCTSCYPASTIALEESNMEFYPNPMNDQAILKMNVNHLPNEVIVLDVFGRKVQQYTSITSPILSIQRNNLSAGIYSIKLKYTDDKVQTSTFIIQ